MRHRNPWSIGLLSAVAILLASSWLRPAAAQCCGSKCKYNLDGTSDCVYAMWCGMLCSIDTGNGNCYDLDCTDVPIGPAGPSASGAFSSPRSSRLCSLPARESAAAVAAVGAPIQAVRLKARS